MIGAQALIASLVSAGVDMCFMNPGTSEMHFVAALDAVPEMRGVLALFEGVATGAADGYARIAGRPGRGAAAPGPRPGQRARQPAQCPPGPQPGRDHRGRSRHRPRQVRLAAAVRHRGPGADRLGLGPHLRHDPRPGPGRDAGRRRGPPRPDRDPGAARRRVVERRRGARAAPARPAAEQPTPARSRRPLPLPGRWLGRCCCSAGRR